MITVGITGGIGSGKTTVCEIFKILGVPVYSADNRAKSLMNDDPELIEAIQQVFGSESYNERGLNRDFLAKEVFNDGDRIQQLNALVHPVVKQDFEHWMGQQSGRYVIKEAALLIENGSHQELDQLIVVDAPESIRMQRVLARDSFRSRQELLEILKKQTSDELRRVAAHHLIFNDGSQLLIPQVLELHNRMNTLSV